MSLLQNPLQAIEQIEWYLENKESEQFPGAFLISAGNLSRQVLEQVLFILAFYSRMPHSKYMKANHQLKTANNIWAELQRTNPTSGLTYFAEARKQGKRIGKFARFPRSLDKWRREFNEPSHYRNPAVRRHTREEHIRAFVSRMRLIMDKDDPYLITAAVNEIMSKGKIKAILAQDERNTPGVQVNVVVTPRHLMFADGKLSLKVPSYPVTVVPDDHEIPYRWSSRVVLVQHSHGMHLLTQLLADDGKPIDITDLQTILLSLARTPEGRKRVERRLKRFGLTIQWPP